MAREYVPGLETRLPTKVADVPAKGRRRSRKIDIAARLANALGQEGDPDLATALVSGELTEQQQVAVMGLMIQDIPPVEIARQLQLPYHLVEKALTDPKLIERAIRPFRAKAAVIFHARIVPRLTLIAQTAGTRDAVEAARLVANAISERWPRKGTETGDGDRPAESEDTADEQPESPAHEEQLTMQQLARRKALQGADS